MINLKKLVKALEDVQAAIGDFEDAYKQADSDDVLVADIKDAVDKLRDALKQIGIPA